MDMHGTLAVASKEKTKAKQRYLKRKKERKKHRSKALESIPHLLEGQKDREPSQISILNESAQTTCEERARRPKKRLKTLEQLEEDDVEMMSQLSDQELEAIPILPKFPLPKLPDVPSKSDLALQGLSQGLTDATFILPTAVLPIPVGKDHGGTRLSEKTRKNLWDNNITELFAVQTALLPLLLPSQESQKALYLPYEPPCDVCVSAPTGSGKTLAYILPIIETLSSRIITKLRALIVVPTRDLVHQVRETFDVISRGTGLKIGTATGQHSFAHEQSQLIQDASHNLQGGSSKIDVLICTPGRLIDHLVGTRNFSLQHLRFLVIDEADRLLAQSFQDWLSQVLAATSFHPKPGKEGFVEPTCSLPYPLLVPDGLAPMHMQSLPYPFVGPFLTEQTQSSCQKLLFSATLTREPDKIAALNLRQPKYFVVQTDECGTDPNIMNVVMEKFSLPSTLTERMVVASSIYKPLMFLHLVHEHQITNALVFTKSAESTTRLVRLFEFFESARTTQNGVEPLVIHAYSSDLPSNERKTILDQFKNQVIHILVCSDLISRGIDISHVSHVINYDAPVDMRKYVHRVGRTARAGRAGNAWTLVEEQEARYFKQMLKEAGHLEQVKRIRIADKDLSPLQSHYETALNKLKDFYSRQN